ncbi:MAG: hypothetical protein WA960_19090, partial [Tunicatimonas sp.]
MNTTTLIPNLPRLVYDRGLAFALVLLSLLIGLVPIHAQTYSGNPILSGYQADPDILIANGKYYIYPTATNNN